MTSKNNLNFFKYSFVDYLSLYFELRDLWLNSVSVARFMVTRFMGGLQDLWEAYKIYGSLRDLWEALRDLWEFARFMGVTRFMGHTYDIPYVILEKQRFSA